MEQESGSFCPQICILSAAGGCGKTTLAVNLFQPFLHDPCMIFMGANPVSACAGEGGRRKGCTEESLC